MLEDVLVLLTTLIVLALPFYKIFEKAKQNPSLAFIPIYSTIVLLKILGRPRWWVIYTIIPFVNIVFSMFLFVETAKCFGKFKFWQHLLSIVPVFNFFYLMHLAFSRSIQWQGPEYVAHNFKRSFYGMLLDAITFILVAVGSFYLVTLKSYSIPASSGEETLLVNDHILVSTLNWGPRISVKSFISPYLRLPGFQKIKNNDMVVFNFPADNEHTVDDKESYVKRCVAIPGDSFKMIDGQVFINNKALPFPIHYQSSYHIITDGTLLENDRKLCDKLGIRCDPKAQDLMEIRGEMFDKPEKGQVEYEDVLLTKQAADELKNIPWVKLIKENLEVEKSAGVRPLFPKDTRLDWQMDHIPSFYVPRKGASIPINIWNFSIYKWAIEYETDGKLDTLGNKVTFNGKIIDKYTFKLDYYFMMGDNRHNSFDSRYWGFVPEDHIIGKPLIILYSTDNNAISYGASHQSRMFKIIDNK